MFQQDQGKTEAQKLLEEFIANMQATTVQMQNTAGCEGLDPQVHAIWRQGKP